MRTIDDAERRARLTARHALATPAPDIDAATEAVVALHSNDPATVYLAARARVRAFRAEHLDEALYERRTLVRMLGMRRTLFVVPRATAAEMDAACTRSYAAAERRRLLGMITAQGLARRNPDAWLEDVCERTYAALAERGTATATQVTRDVPELALKLAFSEGTRWAATVGLSTRVLFLLATDGRIVRARPAGTWISGQYRWATVESWLGAPLPRLDPRPARASLVSKWLRAFGPGTTADIRWWGRWTAAEARAALDDVRAVEVTVGDATPAWVLPDDVDPQRGVAQGVAMLPGLDPTVMGWKDRSWYLGDHAAALFDRNGNAGPTIWSDGRVVGGWAMTGRGVVAFRVLEDVGREVTTAIEADADALTTWLGDVRVTPRFRTPLERDLAG